MATLENAIALAVKAHAGATDRSHQPYILHPLRVMLGVEATEDRIVAILHDVIEDTDYTLDDMREMGFSEAIVAALDAVTRRDEETYEEFIERIALDPLAVRVKLSDLRDNMDIRRLPAVTPDDLQRLERYRKAWERLFPLTYK